MGSQPEFFGPADERLAGGDDAVGLGLAADKVHGHLFAGKARNEVYMDDGEFARRVDPLHDGGNAADVSVQDKHDPDIFVLQRVLQPVIILDRGDDGRFLNGVHQFLFHEIEIPHFPVSKILSSSETL